MVRDLESACQFLHSKEGVTQGGTLAMILYGIGILPLISELCAWHPQVTQPWYAYYSGTGGTFDVLHEHMRDMLARGPLRGYLPEPTKSILVISLRKSSERMHTSGGWGYVWSPEAATPAASLVTMSQRRGGWHRR